MNFSNLSSRFGSISRGVLGSILGHGQSGLLRMGVEARVLGGHIYFVYPLLAGHISFKLGFDFRKESAVPRSRWVPTTSCADCGPNKKRAALTGAAHAI